MIAQFIGLVLSGNPYVAIAGLVLGLLLVVAMGTATNHRTY